MIKCFPTCSCYILTGWTICFMHAHIYENHKTFICNVVTRSPALYKHVCFSVFSSGENTQKIYLNFLSMQERDWVHFPFTWLIGFLFYSEFR